MNDVQSELTRFIQDEVVVDATEVGPDTDLLLTGAVDSLGVIRITHWMEEHVGVVVDPGRCDPRELSVDLQDDRVPRRSGKYLIDV